LSLASAHFFFDGNRPLSFLAAEFDQASFSGCSDCANSSNRSRIGRAAGGRVTIGNCKE
jgi:hypothetical protein